MSSIRNKAIATGLINEIYIHHFRGFMKTLVKRFKYIAFRRMILNLIRTNLTVKLTKLIKRAWKRTLWHHKKYALRKIYITGFYFHKRKRLFASYMTHLQNLFRRYWRSHAFNQLDLAVGPRAHYWQNLKIMHDSPFMRNRVFLDEDWIVSFNSKKILKKRDYKRKRKLIS
jgi:hypothetical protein